MSESSPETLTRTDYNRLEHLGMAGVAAALADTTAVDRWREQFPHWRARHWAYLDDDGVLRLAPVNVARRTPERAAA